MQRPHEGQCNKCIPAGSESRFSVCFLLSTTPVRRRLIAVPVNQSEMVKLAKHAHSRIFPVARSELKETKTTAQSIG